MNAKTKSRADSFPGGVHTPDYAVPPGATISEALEERGMNQRDLAARLGVQEPVVSDLIRGKRPITPETARGLELVLGIPMAFWLRAEARFREHRARIEETQRYQEWAPWAGGFPLREMMNLGWLPSIKANASVERVKSLLAFLQVASPDAWEDTFLRMPIAYRKTRAFAEDENHLGAWLRQGEIVARAMELTPFDRKEFLAALEEIRDWTTEPGGVPLERVQKKTALCGVAVVYTPALPRSRASGAARWLGASQPLIQLSLRGKTDDLFWFTFFHEAAHILLHGHKETFVEIEGSNDPREKEADIWAQNHLIPPASWVEFTRRGRFDLGSIVQFAKQQQIASGIVVGRLQHEGKLAKNQGNRLKKSVVFPESAEPVNRRSVLDGR
jgi:HTH-type transcriptional regulator/antitoxin HigA